MKILSTNHSTRGVTLTEVIMATAVIAVLGTILLVFGVAQLFNPYLMRVEDKAWLDEMAERKAALSS